MTLLNRYVYKVASMLLICLVINSNYGSADDLYILKESKMPQFSYYTVEGKAFANKDLKKNTKIIFMYFNPHCDICINETKNLLGNYYYLQLHDIQLIMVSPNKLEELLTFKNNYGLDRYENIKILHDKEDMFYKQFGAIGYPTLFLFNEQHNQITSFESEVEFEEIKEAFEKAKTASKQATVNSKQ